MGSWLLCATILLLTLSVSTRPGYYSGPSFQAFAPRRFIKISKRRQYNNVLTEYPYLDLINLSAPPPSPFHDYPALERTKPSAGDRGTPRRTPGPRKIITMIGLCRMSV